MFKYWEKVDALNHMNRLLLAFVGVLLAIILGLLLILANAPKRMEFWLSRSMMEQGGHIQPNTIPDEYVHGFVTALIPNLYTWSKAGKQEFSTNLQNYHYYMTPRFRQLMRDTLQTYDKAQWFSRTQVASLYRFMEPDDIKPLGPNAWEVHLVLRLTQRLSDESPMVIADKVVDYHFRVVKVSLSPLNNPFQLALDGYTQPEKRLNDLLVKEDLHAE